VGGNFNLGEQIGISSEAKLSRVNSSKVSMIIKEKNVLGLGRQEQIWFWERTMFWTKLWRWRAKLLLESYLENKGQKNILGS
jgi:hypothetical protein